MRTETNEPTRAERLAYDGESIVEVLASPGYAVDWQLAEQLADPSDEEATRS